MHLHFCLYCMHQLLFCVRICLCVCYYFFFGCLVLKLIYMRCCRWTTPHLILNVFGRFKALLFPVDFSKYLYHLSSWSFQGNPPCLKHQHHQQYPVPLLFNCPKPNPTQTSEIDLLAIFVPTLNQATCFAPILLPGSWHFPQRISSTIIRWMFPHPV